MTETLEWRPTITYPELEASKKGDIRNAITKELLLPAKWVIDRYKRVTYGKHMPAVHRLTAEAWVPNEDPVHYKVVDHIDGDITNNCISNLRWISQSMNIKRGKRGTKHFNQATANEIRKAFLYGESIGKLSKKYNVPSGIISPIVHNRTYKDKDWPAYKSTEICKRLTMFEHFNQLTLHDELIDKESFLFHVFCYNTSFLELLKLEMKKWDIKVKLKYSKVDENEYACEIQ